MANKVFGSSGPPGMYPKRLFKDHGDGSYSERVITETESGEPATQATQAAILAQLNITLSALRDALQGASSKDLSTLETAIAAVQTSTDALRTAKSIDDIETAVLALRTTSTLDTLESDIEAVKGVLDNILGAFEAKSNYGSSEGAALTVDLDTGLYGGRLFVEVWVKSSGAATFKIQGSRDDTAWRDCDEIILAGAGEDHKGFDNAYRYLRVTTEAANDNEAEIVTSR